MKRTRFAPSPTGFLHTGNAFSALQCEQWAKKSDAALLLRIEDIDYTRCRPVFSQKITYDLAWLGISFVGAAVYQQQRLSMYAEALAQLIAMDVLYPCFCTRKEIQQQLAYASYSCVLDSYPKTCLGLSADEVGIRKDKQLFSWRLNQEEVHKRLGEDLYWQDHQGEKHVFSPQCIGDVIIGRKDIQYSYHLAVVVDDAEQGITDVIRGEDLRESTPVHTILQLLLGYSRPLYLHHPLILSDDGQRLAKAKKSLSLKSLREAGMQAAELRYALIEQGL